MLIKKIVIHEDLIRGFKNSALKHSPYEYIEAILGLQKDTTLFVYAFDLIGITSSIETKNYIEIVYDRPEEEIEAGSNLKYFGTIHSHPRYSLEPSDIDKSQFIETINENLVEYDGVQHEVLTDKIMGIMFAREQPKVIEYGLVFYNEAMEKIDLIITETKRGKTI